jgi:hypothetical protein
MMPAEIEAERTSSTRYADKKYTFIYGLWTEAEALNRFNFIEEEVFWKDL